jgi:hypothetical protein
VCLTTRLDGTPAQKGHFRRQKFLRALDWAEENQLIRVEEIGEVTYLRLARPEAEGEKDEDAPEDVSD